MSTLTLGEAKWHCSMIGCAEATVRAVSPSLAAELYAESNGKDALEGTTMSVTVVKGRPGQLIFRLEFPLRFTVTVGSDGTFKAVETTGM
jgi:hypothetical protein